MVIAWTNATMWMKHIIPKDPTAVMMTAAVMVPAPALSLDSARGLQGCLEHAVSVRSHERNKLI
jgi:hypothetical protein